MNQKKLSPLEQGGLFSLLLSKIWMISHSSLFFKTHNCALKTPNFKDRH